MRNTDVSFLLEDENEEGKTEFLFSELEDDAQKKVLDKHRDINVQDIEYWGDINPMDFAPKDGEEPIFEGELEIKGFDFDHGRTIAFHTKRFKIKDEMMYEFLRSVVGLPDSFDLGAPGEISLKAISPAFGVEIHDGKDGAAFTVESSLDNEKLLSIVTPIVLNSTNTDELGYETKPDESTDSSVDKAMETLVAQIEETFDDEKVQDALDRTIAQPVLDALENKYNELISDHSVQASIEENGYKFDSKGEAI